MPVILRSEKGSPLTHEEMDGNFEVVRGNQTDIATLQGQVSALQSDVATLVASVTELRSDVRPRIVAGCYAVSDGAIIGGNANGHPTIQLPGTGSPRLSTTIYIPEELRGVALTVTAHFDVEDFGGQVRIEWLLSEPNDVPPATAFTTSVVPDTNNLNPKVLTTTRQLVGAYPGGLSHFHLIRRAEHADDTYGGILDFYYLRIEATAATLQGFQHISSSPELPKLQTQPAAERGPATTTNSDSTKPSLLDQAANLQRRIDTLKSLK